MNTNQFSPQRQWRGFKSHSADNKSATSHGIREAMWVRVSCIAALPQAMQLYDMIYCHHDADSVKIDDPPVFDIQLYLG